MADESPSKMTVKTLTPLSPSPTHQLQQPSHNSADSTAPSSSSSTPPPSTSPAAEHKLTSSWTIWYNIPEEKPQHHQKDNWNSTLKKAYDCSTLEELFGVLNNIRLPSLLPPKSDLYLFRQGVHPSWEDPANADGGRWGVEATKQEVDKFWLETVVSAVSEQFFAKADESNEIMGIALSCKPKKLKIQLWIRGSEERSTKAIGKFWKEQVLQLPQQQIVEFLSFASALNKNYEGGKYEL